MAARAQKNRPEISFGPYPGGISVAVWRNTITTDDGSREVRSITISPRRYRDENGEWRDAGSYNVGDLPALMFGLQKALDHCFSKPLSNRENEHADDF